MVGDSSTRTIKRRHDRDAWTETKFDGHPYRFHVAELERAFFRGVVAGRFTTKEQFSGLIGVSRSTGSRVFRGRNTSLKVALRVLAELELKFDDVAYPITDK